MLDKILTAEELPITIQALNRFKKDIASKKEMITTTINNEIHERVGSIGGRNHSMVQSAIEGLMSNSTKHPTIKDKEVTMIEYIIAYKMILADLYKKELTIELMLKKLETVTTL